MAKRMIHGELEKLNVDGFPDRFKRRVGDNKGRGDVDDLFTLLAKADEMLLLSNLPKFVAANLEKVPSLKPEELDMIFLAKKVDKLEKLVMQSAQYSNCNTTRISDPSPPVYRTLGVESVQHPENEDQPAGVPATVEVVTAPSTEWATLAGNLTNDDFTVVTKKNGVKTSSKVARRVVGTRSASNVETNRTGIKTVPRRLTAFVGRLHQDTVAGDLVAMPAESGINDVKCYKLEPKNGAVFSTAAFCVSCPASYEDVFYDHTTWPDGCELRDWVFKNAKQ